MAERFRVVRRKVYSSTRCIEYYAVLDRVLNCSCTCSGKMLPRLLKSLELCTEKGAYIPEDHELMMRLKVIQMYATERTIREAKERVRLDYGKKDVQGMLLEKAYELAVNLTLGGERSESAC